MIYKILHPKDFTCISVYKHLLTKIVDIAGRMILQFKIGMSYFHYLKTKVFKFYLLSGSGNVCALPQHIRCWYTSPENPGRAAWPFPDFSDHIHRSVPR